MKASTLAAALVLVTLHSTAHAGAILDASGPIIRPTFDTNFWCPINFYYVSDFVADGPDITVEFVAQNRSTLYDLAMNQRIDNVAVLEKSVYEANLGPSTVGMKDIFCLNVGDELFFFQNVAPADFVFFDQFATAPAPGWDLSDGAFYYDDSNPGASAPNDLVNPLPVPTGGSLGLGESTNPAAMVSTQITISGLTAGTEYVMHCWWRSKVDDDMDGNPFPDGDLWITIFGSDSSPVVPSTWSQVKALYR